MEFDREATIELARDAYWAALREERTRATGYVQKINDEHGAAAVLLAICSWIDTYVDHVTDGGDAINMKRLQFIERHTRRVDTLDSPWLPEEVRWAGRVIYARATMNPDLFLDLVNGVEGNAEAGYRVMILLDLVAQTIKNMPRGFAKKARAAPLN